MDLTGIVVVVTKLQQLSGPPFPVREEKKKNLAGSTKHTSVGLVSDNI